jgi:hypothetical protein
MVDRTELSHTELHSLQTPERIAADRIAAPELVDRLALALCRTRRESPAGVQFGGVWRPEGVTFLEIARRDVRAVLTELEAARA